MVQRTNGCALLIKGQCAIKKMEHIFGPQMGFEQRRERFYFPLARQKYQHPAYCVVQCVQDQIPQAYFKGY